MAHSPDSPDITVCALRALADYAIVTGFVRKQLSPTISEGQYEAHWTGTEWAKCGGKKPVVFSHKKYAEDYLDENRELIAEVLREFNRSAGPPHGQ